MSTDGTLKFRGEVAVKDLTSGERGRYWVDVERDSDGNWAVQAIAGGDRYERVYLNQDGSVQHVSGKADNPFSDTSYPEPNEVQLYDEGGRRTDFRVEVTPVLEAVVRGAERKVERWKQSSEL